MSLPGRSGWGSFFGLLGPNGTGKSTIRMISGLARRSSSELRILGLAPDRHGPRIRARPGVVLGLKRQRRRR